MANEAVIRVMLVDDHHMVRKGLAAYIKQDPGLAVVGEAADGEEAVRIFPEVKPDVVLMDLVMPRMEGPEATQKLRQLDSNVQVIALTSFHERDLVKEALQAGAISYLLKNITGEELARAIRSAYCGASTLAPEVAQVLVHAAAAPDEPLIEELSPREYEVLTLLVEGFTNPEIAAQLTISTSTARAHVSHILNKLCVSNRSEAVALALRKGLVK